MRSALLRGGDRSVAQRKWRGSEAPLAASTDTFSLLCVSPGEEVLDSVRLRSEMPSVCLKLVLR